MNIFAIGDLHLPGRQDKPMDVFGGRWKDHADRIASSWRARVAPDDLVLVPGDLSWAMKLEEAADDLAYLGALPGTAVLIRGNHDYWWQSIGKVRKALPPNVVAIQNDHASFGGNWAVCGTRGWNLPKSEGFDEHDEKILAREVQRLELSLRSAEKAGLEPAIVLMHYPPTERDGRETEFTRLMEAFNVRLCVYGHLHGEAGRRALQGVHRGVKYVLAACDQIAFTPLKVAKTGGSGYLILVD